MEIGARLREERERLKLRQEELAALCDAGASSISNWKNGTSFPNARVLAAFAEAGADVGYILTGRRAARIEEPAADYQGLTPREAAILDLLRGLGEDGLREIQAVAEKEKRLQALESALSRLQAG